MNLLLTHGGEGDLQSKRMAVWTGRAGCPREQGVLTSGAVGPQSWHQQGFGNVASWQGSANAMSGGQCSRLLLEQSSQTLSSSWQEAKALKRVSNSSLQLLPPSVGGSGMHRLRDQHRPDPPPPQSPLPLQSFVLPVLNQPSEVKALFVSSGLSQYSRNTEAPLTSSSPSFSSNPGVTFVPLSFPSAWMM